jgi:phage/plasmid-like protein (TIGR03299 family)
MAHMIDFSNNRANMAYTGPAPWHGLGNFITPDMPFEEWPKKAGFDWHAMRVKEQYSFNGQLIQSGDDILCRSDTGAKLGNCTKRYHEVQPIEFVEYFRGLVNTMGWTMETMGCLDGGKRIWALAKCGAEFGVGGTIDKVAAYNLLAGSFDGTMSTIAKFTSIRTVCQNTLTMGLNDGLAAVKVNHKSKFDAEAIKAKLGIGQGAFKQVEEEANLLAKRKLTDKEAVRFIISVLNGPDTKPEELSTRAANLVTGVFSKYKGAGMGATLASANGTAWGALNAITEYVDHEQGRNSNNRIREAWFGKGEQTKQKARLAALALAA